MSDFPTKPDELSAQWLTSVLGFPVTDFKVSYFGEGAGIMAMVTRLQLTTDAANPQTIIAKFPSPSADNRAVASTYSMYEREVRFYDGIASQVKMRTPACYYAAFDPDSENFVLLMEDVGHLRIGDQVAGCTLAEAKAVLSAVAGLHASTWGAQQFPNLISHNNPAQRDGMIGGFQVGWPVVNAQFPELIPASAAVAGEAMPGAVGRLLDEMTVDPVCLSHTDVRLDNIFFDGDDVLFVDWQSICTSCPEQDVAYFITQSVAPEVRAQEDLLAFYHRQLVSQGIDYDYDFCRERYRVASLYLLCFAVVIAGTLDLANERGQALGRVLTRNAMSALDEMNAFELL